MAKTFKLQNIRSAEQSKMPQSGQIEYGQIAVNYYEGDERLYIKNSKQGVESGSTENIVAFIPEHTIDVKIATAIENNVKLSDDYKPSDKEYTDLEPVSGDTFEEVTAKFHKAILDNEEVVAAALTRLNKSCGFDENLNYTPNSRLLQQLQTSSLSESCDILATNVNAIADVVSQIPSIPTGKTSYVLTVGQYYPNWTEGLTKKQVEDTYLTKTAAQSTYLPLSTEFKTINGQEIKGSGDITIDLTIYQIVPTLPDDANTADPNKIYLVLNTESGTTGESNTYTEYLAVGDEGSRTWEILGEYKANVDLTSYYTKEEIDSKLGDYYNKSEISNTLSGYCTQEQLTTALDDYYTKTDADGLFLTQSAATETYLTKDDASNTYQAKGNYALKSDISDMLTKTEAGTTYATKSEISDMLTKTEANSTYAKITDLDNYYTKSETYTKTETDNAITSATTLSSGYTASDLTNANLEPKPNDTHETAIGKLHKAILDNEEVISAALNKLNYACGFNSTIGYEPSDSLIVDAKTLTEAIEIVATEIRYIKQRLDALENPTT